MYRVTRRVFSEPVTSKLHLLNTKNLAGHLKTPKVIRISAMHANSSHSPVHSGPICFNRTKNLKLPSGTNKTKKKFHFHKFQPRITLKNCGDQKFFLKILLSNYYIKLVSKRNEIQQNGSKPITSITFLLQKKIFKIFAPF
jgi:hypothetical protein